MKRTENLNLPIYDNPESDIFKINDVNNAHEMIDKQYKELKNIKETVESTNPSANLQGQINDINASLEHKANEFNSTSLYSKSYQNVDYTVRKNQYKFYQAVIKNPNNFAVNNTPVGIYIAFDLDECLGVDYIKITDDEGNIIPFQWEDDVDQKTLRNLGKYKDNSLKFGTIWIMQDLTANEEKIINITVYDYEQNNNFTKNVTHTVLTENSIEALNANNTQITFQANINWLLRRLKVGDVDYSPNITAVHGAINKDDYSQLDSSDGTLTTAVSHSYSGSGVIFMDWEVKLTYNYNSNVMLVHKYRLFANGNIELDCRHYITGNVAEGQVSGVVNKISLQNVLGGTYEYDSSKYYYATQENSTQQVLIGIRDIQNKGEYDDSNGYPISLLVQTNTTDQKVISGWLLQPSHGTRTTVKGQMWSSRYFISINYGKGNREQELQKMHNRIFSRATKNNKNELRRKFISMGKRFAEDMRSWNAIRKQVNGNSYFWGLQGLESYGAYKLWTGDITDLEKAREQLYSSLNRFYAGGSVEGFYNAWYDKSRGLEFTGRDVRLANYLRKEYILLGDTAKATSMTNIIHNLATAMVQIETTSGGEGKVGLRYGTLDNFNAEAAALIALADSLAITESVEKRNCYNRIVARFNSGAWWNCKLPYDQNNESDFRLLLKNPSLHYHAFSLFDYYHANNIVNFGDDVEKVNYSQYCFEATTPSGQAREIGSQYNPSRRGSPLTLLYVSGLLMMEGYKNNNISDMEHACMLLEHVLTRMLPNLNYKYPVEYPIDGWNYCNNGDFETIGAVCSQVIIEAMLNI